MVWSQRLLPATFHHSLVFDDDLHSVLGEEPVNGVLVELLTSEGITLAMRNRHEDYCLLIDLLKLKYELLESYLSWSSLAMIYRHYTIATLLQSDFLQLHTLAFKVTKPV